MKSRREDLFVVYGIDYSGLRVSVDGCWMHLHAVRTPGIS